MNRSCPCPTAPMGRDWRELPSWWGASKRPLGPVHLVWAGTVCLGWQWHRGIALVQALWDWGPLSWRRSGGHWRLAAIPVASLEACEEQAEVVSRWWASAGKGNTSLTACLSSASAAKYPPSALGQLHNGEQRPNQKYSQPRRSGSRH